MPRSAIANGAADEIVKTRDIADRIRTPLVTPLKDLGEEPEAGLTQAVAPSGWR